MTDSEALLDEREALRAALRGMVALVDDVISDSEGHYPLSDAGCNHCTQGCTPAMFDTGLCAYHGAKVMLRADDGR